MQNFTPICKAPAEKTVTVHPKKKKNKQETLYQNGGDYSLYRPLLYSVRLGLGLESPPKATVTAEDVLVTVAEPKVKHRQNG